LFWESAPVACLPIRSKSHNSNIRLIAIDQEFYAEVGKTHVPQYWTFTLHRSCGHDPATVPKFKYLFRSEIHGISYLFKLEFSFTQSATLVLYRCMNRIFDRFIKINHLHWLNGFDLNNRQWILKKSENFIFLLLD
jgi:hypothetical protein